MKKLKISTKATLIVIAIGVLGILSIMQYIHMNSKGNSIFVDYDLANDWYYGIDDEDIKSIVTKEAFESISYKV